MGGDGAALVSTLDTTGVNTLVRFDRTQALANQLTSILTPPPPSTPTPAPSATLSTPVTKFLSKLAATPDGNYIVGITNPTTTTSYMFVYEVSSGSILRSRTVTGQSTVLAISPDGSRFMAGYTLYDIATLSVLGQMNNANAPFSFSATFSTVANIGGSVFSPDGTTLYGAFNVAANSNPPPPTNSSTLLLSDPNNLGIHLGIRLPESIVAKVVVTRDGANALEPLRSPASIYLHRCSTPLQPPDPRSRRSTQVFLTPIPATPVWRKLHSARRQQSRRRQAHLRGNHALLRAHHQRFEWRRPFHHYFHHGTRAACHRGTRFRAVRNQPGWFPGATERHRA